MKSLKILEKILAVLSNLKEALEKDEPKDYLAQIGSVIKIAASSVKELSMEFRSCTNRLKPLLTIATLISMIVNVTSLSILYQSQVLNTLSFLSLAFMTLFITFAVLLSLHLRLLSVLILEPLAILPSATASAIGLIFHSFANPTLIILTILNITLLAALLRFLILQANAYKIAISITASIYHVIVLLKNIIENKFKTQPATQYAMPSEDLLIKIYGDEASELIKYTVDANKVK